MSNIDTNITNRLNESISKNVEISQNLKQANGTSNISPENFSRAGAAIRSSSANAQNQFYNDFLNKTVKQIVLDLDQTSKLNELINMFSVGQLTEGNKIEVVTSGKVQPKDIEMDEGDTNNPFTIKKSKVWVHSITLGKDKLFEITTYPHQVRRAMSSPSNMAKLIANISSKVSKSIDVYYWNIVKSTIVDYQAPAGSTPITKNVGTASSTANDIFEAITAIAKEMEFPTSEFNEGVSVGGTITPLEQNYSPSDIILVLNPKMDAAFQVKTYAALYNLLELKAKSLKVITLPFTKLDGTPITDVDKTPGYILVKDRIKTAWGHKGIKSYIGPNTDILYTAGNTAFAVGHVPFANMVKLTIT